MPVGAERHTEHRADMAGERGADRLAGIAVPQPHRLVVVGRGQAVPVRAERHTGHGAGVAGDDLQGAGPLGHRGIEGAVGGVVLGQRVGGQNLLESPHVPAGDGASQHALGLGDQLLRGRGPQVCLRLLPGAHSLSLGVHGGEGRDQGERGDDSRCGQHGAHHAGASAQGGGVRLGGFLTFPGGTLVFLGGAQFGGLEFGLLALHLGFVFRRPALFCAPPVAVFAYNGREHIVRQFDPFRASAFLEA